MEEYEDLSISLQELTGAIGRIVTLDNDGAHFYLDTSCAGASERLAKLLFSNAIGNRPPVYFHGDIVVSFDGRVWVKNYDETWLQTGIAGRIPHDQMPWPLLRKIGSIFEDENEE